jgi:hypothetical protein
MSLDRVACLKRAKKLIDTGTQEALRYAALELRYCIEAICYDKVRLYEKQIPQTVIDTWQPRKLIEALEQFDPHLNEESQFVLYPEGPDGKRGKGVLLGKQTPIGPSILKKHYYKLGSLLHVPTPSKRTQTASQNETASYLRSLTDVLHEAATNRFQSNIAETVSCDCCCCDGWIVRNLESIGEDLRLDCPFCGAHYTLEPHGDAHIWHLDQAEWDCPVCQEKNYTARHLIRDNVALKCHGCDTSFPVQKRFALVVPADAKEPGT